LPTDFHPDGISRRFSIKLKLDVAKALVPAARAATTYAAERMLLCPRWVRMTRRENAVKQDGGGEGN